MNAEKVLTQLELIGYTKRYGNNIANNSVNFKIHQGEIKALLGENGAGKSTLVKMICGIVIPDSGELFWQGSKSKITTPKIAKKMGIGMVFQHFSLFEAMTVLDNIALSLDDRYQPTKLIDKIKKLSENYGLKIEPERVMSSLSVGEKQRVEIIRCLMQNPKLLILDEPTAVLTPQEADKLFITIHALAKEGCAVLYISHRLDEVRRICHSATIMRSGKVICDIDPRQKTSKEIAELMLGEQILIPRQDPDKVINKVRLSVKNLQLPADPKIPRGGLKNINITLHRGEIYAIAGISGNGQNELMSVLSGEICLNNSELIVLEGKNIANKGIAARRELGMGVAYVPEERLGHGAVADMTLSENVLLTSVKAQKLLHYGFIDHKKTNQFAQSIINNFKVRAESVFSYAKELSGGNLQKFIVGREITQSPKVILAAQPTWGVDAGAASQIQQTLINLANQGCSVILLSQDLDEVFAIANCVSIMFEGQLSKPYPVSEITLEEIGMLMVGESIEKGQEQ